MALLSLFLSYFSSFSLTFFHISLLSHSHYDSLHQLNALTFLPIFLSHFRSEERKEEKTWKWSRQIIYFKHRLVSSHFSTYLSLFFLSKFVCNTLGGPLGSLSLPSHLLSFFLFLPHFLSFSNSPTISLLTLHLVPNDLFISFIHFFPTFFSPFTHFIWHHVSNIMSCKNSSLEIQSDQIDLMITKIPSLFELIESLIPFSFEIYFFPIFSHLKSRWIRMNFIHSLRLYYPTSNPFPTHGSTFKQTNESIWKSMKNEWHSLRRSDWKKIYRFVTFFSFFSYFRCDFFLWFGD